MEELNDKQNVEIAVLRERVEHVIKKVDDIKDNHLPTITKRIGTLEIRVACGGTILAVIITLLQIFL